MADACNNCGNERVVRCIYCQDDGVSKDVDAELTRLRAELAAEKEAVRVLGEEVYSRRSHISCSHAGPRSEEGETITDWQWRVRKEWEKTITAMDATDANPIAAAAVKEKA